MVRSLLDLDYYKLTMMQFAYFKYKDIKVGYKFTNRTKIKLAQYIDVEHLRSELDTIKMLKFSDEELNWLSSNQHVYEKGGELVPTFHPEFIEYLKNFQLSSYILEVENDDFIIETPECLWHESILWETMILSTINELYYVSKYQNRDSHISTGSENLFNVVSTLIGTDIKFSDFGTRRRYSLDWQKNVVDLLSNSLSSNLIGSSNCLICMEKGLKPIGTNAHELYMIATGVYRADMRGGHGKILDEWYDFYGYDFSIALTDTFGTNFFFKDFTKERAEKWKGLRHDSGCPFKFGDKVIKYYESMGIPPMDKLIVFSDGLSLEKIIELYNYFKNRINISFGWGTKLTNNMGVETLSIVMKAYIVSFIIGDEEYRNYLVKLSDNLNKNMGREEDLILYRDVFEYVNIDREETIV